MAYGNHRFLTNNLARTAYLADWTAGQVSTIEYGRIGGIQKTGTGSAIWKAAGEYIGRKSILIVSQIDAIGTGEVGSSTFRWRIDEITGEGSWEASGVSTSTSYTSLGPSGIGIAWEQGSGADFVLFDSGVFICNALFGPGRLFDLDRDTYYQSLSYTNEVPEFEQVTNGDFASDISGWTALAGTGGGTIAWDTGTIKLTQGATSKTMHVYQELSLDEGKRYYYEIEVTATNVGTISWAKYAIGTSIPTAGLAYTGDVLTSTNCGAVNTYTGYFFGGSINYLCLTNGGDVTQYINFDNVTIKEVNCRITIDLGSAQTIQANILGDHNLASGNWVALQGNTSNSWESPAYELQLDETTDPTIDYLSQSYRYWSLEFSGYADYIQLSQWYLGTYTELVDAQTPPETAITTKRNLIENISEVGIRRQRIHTTQRTFPLVFKYIDETDTDSLQTIWEALFDTDTGEVKPLWLHYFYDENDTLIFCRCVSDFEKEFYRANIFNVVSLQFEEVPKSRI